MMHGLLFALNTLLWRHNDNDGVSNHQPRDCLLNRLFRRRSKKISKLRVTGLCVGNSPGPVNSPHKGPVTRKMFPFDDVIMRQCMEYMTSSVFPSIYISVWLAHIKTWAWCFPDFDILIPPSTNSYPPSTDSRLVAFLLLKPSPRLAKRTYSSINVCLLYSVFNCI